MKHNGEKAQIIMRKIATENKFFTKRYFAHIYVNKLENLVEENNLLCKYSLLKLISLVTEIPNKLISISIVLRKDTKLSRN